MFYLEILSKIITPKIIIGLFLIILGIWFQFTYSIITKQTLKINKFHTESLETKLDKYILENNNLTVQLKEEQSKNESCLFEQDMLNYLNSEQGEDYENIKPNVDYLPF